MVGGYDIFICCSNLVRKGILPPAELVVECILLEEVQEKYPKNEDF